MTKEEMIQAVDARFVPQIEALDAQIMPLDIQRTGLKNEYEAKKQEVQAYFEALAVVEEVNSRVNNPPVI